MEIIADTNVFLAVVLGEADREQILQLTARTSLKAPEILPYEWGNALSAMVKRKKLSASEAMTAQTTLEKIPVQLVSVNVYESLKIALLHNIYTYDAYFLQCALTHKLPLLTLDQRMKAVAQKMGIATLE